MKNVLICVLTLTLLGFSLLFASFSVSAETFLMMAEEHNCSFCAKWDKEIAPIYPKTSEGKIAPIKKFYLYAQQPNITFKKPVRFTPTFILVRDNQELGRIEGYMGDEHFWSLLNVLFKRANISTSDEV